MVAVECIVSQTRLTISLKAARKKKEGKQRALVSGNKSYENDRMRR